MGKPTTRGSGTPRGKRRAAKSAGTRVDCVQLKCVREQKLGRSSRRTAAVGLHFGIPLFGSTATIVEATRVSLEPGKVILLTGPSGSGKSSALGQIDRHRPGACMVQRVTFPPETAIIDRVAPWASLDEAISIMTTCSLGEPRLWVRRFSELSDGEKFRAQLARAVGLQVRSHSGGPLLCDEFCSTLHRRVAKAISYNLRKLVTRRNLIAVLACSNEDVIPDLQPNVVVRLMSNGRCEVTEPNVRVRRQPSFAGRLRIEPGTKRDYDAFAAMHYRATDELGFIDKVFLLRDGGAGEALGIVAYGRGPLELKLRNMATDRKFSCNPKRVNRDMRILRRLVIHPDVRGCGLGHYLVRETLPLVGTEYVECLAAMGEFNPVFEKAGMDRFGQYDVSPTRRAALNALKEMDVDPNSREFPLQVCRRRRVREIVAGVVYDWYSNVTVGGESRVTRQSPETLAQTFRGLIANRPVYYLWRRKRKAA